MTGFDTAIINGTIAAIGPKILRVKITTECMVNIMKQVISIT